MKDCSYVASDKGVPTPVNMKESKEDRYPSFNVYDTEAVKAIFGDMALTAGQEYEINPIRVRVKRVTSEEGEGVSNVELSVVGVGTIKSVGKRQKGEDMEEHDEEED